MEMQSRYARAACSSFDGGMRRFHRKGVSMNPKRLPSPSICPPMGTYIIDYYADGSLDLMRVLSEPLIHPARTFKTTIEHHILEWWDLPVENVNNPEPTKGKCYLSESAMESIRPATDDDFKAFILEQKQSLIDLRKNKDHASRMKPWFRTGAITAYKWWIDYRKKKGMRPPPPFGTIVPAGQRSLDISEDLRCQ